MRVYHGTSKESAQVIMQSGFRKGSDIFVTDQYELARYHAAKAVSYPGHTEPVIIRIMIPDSTQVYTHQSGGTIYKLSGESARPINFTPVNVSDLMHNFPNIKR